MAKKCRPRCRLLPGGTPFGTFRNIHGTRSGGVNLNSNSARHGMTVPAPHARLRSPTERPTIECFPQFGPRLTRRRDEPPRATSMVRVDPSTCEQLLHLSRG